MQIEPVGVVRSPVTEALDERWGDVVAEIHVRPELAPGLRGIEPVVARHGGLPDARGQL